MPPTAEPDSRGTPDPPTARDSRATPGRGDGGAAARDPTSPAAPAEPPPPDARAATAPAGTRCPILPVLLVTLLASFGTGLFWHGLGFIAESVHGFGPADNLVLFAVMGAAYVAGAFSTHRVTALLERAATPRTVLAGTLIVQAAACVPVAIWSGVWTLWLAALVGTVASSLTWPLVEAYLAAGRHGRAMRRAIAAFNVTWMPAVAVPMFVVGPLMDELQARSIALMAPLALLAALAVAWMPRRPGAHDEGLAAVATGDSYPALLRSARILLPLSYVLTSAMSPLLPFRFRDLEVAIEWATPATTTWMAARIAVLVLMWRLPVWHGRWDVLLGGGLATVGGFAGVMLLPSLPAVLAAFTVFGAGLGVVYYAALYYGMTVGRAGVDAGGTHEGLIGLGYCLGPMVALIGVTGGGAGGGGGGADPAGAAGGAPGTGAEGITTAILLLAGVTLVAAIPAVRPWLHDRRRTAAARRAAAGPGRAADAGPGVTDRGDPEG